MEQFANIRAALDAHDDDAVDDAVRELISEAGEIAVHQLAELCEQLKAQRAFEPLGLLADAALAAGHTGRFWADLAQSHIERGRYATATAVLERAIADERIEPPDRLELLGLRGRMAKDRYLAHGNPDDLRAAIDAYTSGIDRGGDLLWLGVNAHALAHRARRDGMQIDPLAIPDERAVLATAHERSADDDWAAATAVEAALLVGLPVPTDTIVHRLGDSSPFVHASLRRQLTEVWGLADDHPAIVTLSEFLLRTGSTTSIQLPTDAAGFEKLLGTEWPVPIETYRMGLQAAESVAHVLLQDQLPIGTAFLIDGAAVHESLEGRAVLVTNEHVIPRPERNDGAPANAITVRFDAHDHGSIGGFEALWWCDRDELDAVLLVSPELDRLDIPRLRPVMNLPPVMPGAHVYIVGHPGGRSLCLSIRGNDLLDHDGVRIHYLSPTEKGSSGSPVFDQAWNLVGIHHYGSNHVARLHGQPGTYGANEGISFVAVRDRLVSDGFTGGRS